MIITSTNMILLSLVNSLLMVVSSETYLMEFQVDTPNEGEFRVVLFDEDNGDEIELSSAWSGFSPQGATVSFTLDASSLETLTSMYIISTSDNEDSLKITNIYIDDLTSVDMTNCNNGHHCLLEDLDITDTDCTALVIDDMDTNSPAASVIDISGELCSDDTKEPTSKPSIEPSAPTISPAPTEMPVGEPSKTPLEIDEPTSEPVIGSITGSPTLEPTMLDAITSETNMQDKDGLGKAWNNFPLSVQMIIIISGIFIFLVLLRLIGTIKTKWNQWRNEDSIDSLDYLY